MPNDHTKDEENPLILLTNTLLRCKFSTKDDSTHDLPNSYHVSLTLPASTKSPPNAFPPLTPQDSPTSTFPLFYCASCGKAFTKKRKIEFHKQEHDEPVPELFPLECETYLQTQTTILCILCICISIYIKRRVRSCETNVCVRVKQISPKC